VDSKTTENWYRKRLVGADSIGGENGSVAAGAAPNCSSSKASVSTPKTAMITIGQKFSAKFFVIPLLSFSCENNHSKSTIIVEVGVMGYPDLGDGAQA
jgi:hypothetical protein